MSFYAELVTLLTKSDIRSYQDFWVLSTGPRNPHVNLCPKSEFDGRSGAASILFRISYPVGSWF